MIMIFKNALDCIGCTAVMIEYMNQIQIQNFFEQIALTIVGFLGYVPLYELRLCIFILLPLYSESSNHLFLYNARRRFQS